MPEDLKVLSISHCNKIQTFGSTDDTPVVIDLMFRDKKWSN
jgi:hypothetical protein